MGTGKPTLKDGKHHVKIANYFKIALPLLRENGGQQHEGML